jgi:hypothetical protein
MWQNSNAYRILVEKPEGKRPLGKPRCRWVDNIKIDLREAGYSCMDWINLAQDMDWCGAPVNTATFFALNKLFRNSWIVAQLAASQQELGSIKVVI